MVHITGAGRRSRRGSRLVALLAGALLGLVLAGCAGTGTSTEAPSTAAPPTAGPSPSATYSDELCSAAAAYQQAVAAVADLDAVAVGVDGVKAALQNLQSATSDLAATAREQFAPQVAELERAVDGLRGTIAGLSDQDSVSTNLGRIAAAVGEVEQAARPIVDTVRTGCPGVPPDRPAPTS